MVKFSQAQPCDHEIKIKRWKFKDEQLKDLNPVEKIVYENLYVITGNKFKDDDEIFEYPKHFVNILVTDNYIVFKIDYQIFYYNKNSKKQDKDGGYSYNSGIEIPL